MTGGLPPLVGLHGGWRRTGMNKKQYSWNPAVNLLQWSTILNITMEGIRVAKQKKVDTAGENIVLAPLMVTKPSLVPSTTIPSADRVEQSTPSLSPEDSSCQDGGQNPSISPLGEHHFNTFESARFFVIKTQETFTNVSPCIIEKAISGSVGTVKLIRKMRSGDLFLEVSSSTQAKTLANLKKLAHLDVNVVAHGSLNSSRGVISPADFLNVSNEEILENMRDQKVCAVRRITIRKDGQVLNTKHLILTFSTPDLPQFVKMAYLRCPVREYIPNPLRCFNCQRYGHSKNVCRGQPTCPRCGEVGHDSNDCSKKERCVNCKGEDPAYSRACPTWKQEKEITTVKIKNKISYPEARRVVSSRTPVPGNSPPPTKNSPPSTKKSSPSTTNSPPPAKKKILSRPPSTSPKRPKSRKARQREMSLSKHPRKISNFSKKSHLMDEDMLELHPDDDEDLMDMMPGSSKPSSERGARATQ
ncbi:uncharacterized protein TNCV_2796671 [Trichonephila clavipes]|nr:uncharacterized protein TNCV_2796671 [Trichonephila clavipes]